MIGRTQFVGGLFIPSMLFAFATGANAQQSLVTPGRIGKPDAPKTMTFRVNPDQSHTQATPAHAEGYRRLFQAFVEKRPDWQIRFEFFTTDIGGEHARMLEQARAGRAPDCAAVDSFQLALFVKQGALKPVTQFVTKAEIDDLFPFIRNGITGPDGQIYAWWWNTDLRVLAADLGGAEGGGASGDQAGRRRRSLQRRPVGGHGLRLAGAFLEPRRRTRRRRRQAHLRRGREPHQDAEGAHLLQGPRGQRRRPGPGDHDRDL